MKSRHVTVAWIFLLSATIFAQDIPEGVHYKRAKPSVNSKFVRDLAAVLAGKISDDKVLSYCSDVIVCGPRLWPNILKIDPHAGGQHVTFMIPHPDGQAQRLEGRRLRSNKDRFSFILTLQAMASLAPSKIRPLKRTEIAYYWAIIPYDIQEPIVAIENKQLTLLVDGGQGKIFFVDLLPKSK